MTKYNTGNPVGSADPRDLYDTATVADKLAQGTEAAYPDRLGVSRKSWAGIEAEAAAFFESSGYEFVGDYAAGIELTRYSQVVRDTAGEFWRASGSTTLPYITTGAGLPEGGAFVAVGDAVLRQELAASTTGQGSDLIAHTGTTESVTEALGKRTIYVGSVAEIEALSLPVGTNVYLTQDGRAGPGVIKSGAHATDLQKGIFIDLANGNYWERTTDYVTPEMFGANPSAAVDDRSAVQGALDSGLPVRLLRRYDILSLSSETTVNLRSVAVVIRDGQEIQGKGGFSVDVACDYAAGSLGRINNFRLNDFFINKGPSNPAITVGLGLNEEYCPYGTLKNIATGGFVHGILWATFVSTISECSDNNSDHFLSIQNPNHLAGADNNATAATSLTMTACYAIASKVSAFNFGQIVYSTMNSCAADRVNLVFNIGRAMGLTINGQGVEGANKLIYSADTRGIHFNSGYAINLGQTTEPHQPATAPDYFFEFRRASSDDGRFEISQFELRASNPSTISDIFAGRSTGFISGHNGLTYSTDASSVVNDFDKGMALIEETGSGADFRYTKYTDGSLEIRKVLTGFDWSIDGVQIYTMPTAFLTTGATNSGIDGAISFTFQREQGFNATLRASASSLAAFGQNSGTDIGFAVTSTNVRTDNTDPIVVVRARWK